MTCDIFSDFSNALKIGAIVIIIGFVIIGIFAIKSIFEHFESKQRQKENEKKERLEMRENLSQLKQAARKWDLPTLKKELQEVEQAIKSLEESMKKSGYEYADKTVYLVTIVDIDTLREFRSFLKSEIARKTGYR